MYICIFKCIFITMLLSVRFIAPNIFGDRRTTERVVNVNRLKYKITA